MPPQCEALVVHCIDYRLQEFLNKWLDDKLPTGGFDRVAIAGGVHDVFYVLRQVEIAVRLHQIKKVILVNHEDCGAYGIEGDYARHQQDLAQASRKISALFPKLDVETYYLHLDGEFEAMFPTNR
jgi:carbonic anhydrase